MALPVQLGGLGIINPTKLSSLLYTASLSITQCLCDLILMMQSTIYQLSCALAQQDAKKCNCSPPPSRERLPYTPLKPFPPHLQRILQASSEKGFSSWLTSLSWFCSNKGDFQDVLCFLAGNLLHFL